MADIKKLFDKSEAPELETDNFEETGTDTVAPEVIPFDVLMHGDYKLLAVEKIRKETENFNATNPKSQTLKNALSTAMVGFCNENAIVAEVIYRTARTLGDCCDFIIAEVEKLRKETAGTSYYFGGVLTISDAEIYTKALRFYFPESEVKSVLTIELGHKPSEEEMSKAYERPAPASKAKKGEKAKKEPAKKAAKKPEKKENDQVSLLDNEPTPAPVETAPVPDTVAKPAYAGKCSVCGTGITKSMLDWSLIQFGKHLCKKCQKKAEAEKNEDSFIQLSLL